MAMYLEQGYREFMPEFYVGTGFGLAAAGIISIIRNLQYLRNPELKEKRRIYETDERNRMLGLRCWAYTGYTMMFMLYIGVLVSGFISTFHFSIAYGFVSLKTMGHTTSIHVK